MKQAAHCKTSCIIFGCFERYLEKHEERMEEEKRFLRQVADDKYSRTHDYNLIAGAYYDKKKEKEFVESRGKLGVMQGRAQQHRLPPSVRYCEGNSFDIINKQVRNAPFLFLFSMFNNTIINNSAAKWHSLRYAFYYIVLCLLGCSATI